MASQPLSIQLGDGALITGRLYATGAGDASATIVLAHGAGAGQTHPFMVRVASGLAARGVRAVTFNFRYMDAGRRSPDTAPVLLCTWADVIAWVRSALPDVRDLVIGGKSMGGRIASMLVAERPDVAASLSGLVLLGYPLHPPGRPSQLRVAHLAGIQLPTLVLQGTRDDFGAPDEIAAHFGSLPNATLVPVDGGDHSFAVPKRAGRTEDAVFDGLLDRIAAWVRVLA